MATSVSRTSQAGGAARFAGTPAGCAAALKTLEIFERDNILDHAAMLGELAREKMADWEARYDIVGQVRTHGLLMGVSFRDPEAKVENYYFARSVRDAMLRRGVWAICDNEPQVRMYPALNMSADVLTQALDLMEESIDQVQREGVSIGDYPPMPSGNVGF